MNNLPDVRAGWARSVGPRGVRRATAGGLLTVCPVLVCSGPQQSTLGRVMCTTDAYFLPVLGAERSTPRRGRDSYL